MRDIKIRTYCKQGEINLHEWMIGVFSKWFELWDAHLYSKYALMMILCPDFPIINQKYIEKSQSSMLINSPMSNLMNTVI